MILDLFGSPMLFVAWLVAITVSLTVHEFSHALAAAKLGDETAKNLGRLTLNPLAHVSGLGFLMLVMVGFGWGKPVPFNPLNLKDKRLGPMFISIAGPLSNLVLAIIGIVAMKVLFLSQILPPENLLIQFLNLFIIINLILMIFNLLPIPPLDGSKILYAILHDRKYQPFVYSYEKNGPLILLGLLVLDNIIGLNIFGWLFQGIINLVYQLVF